MNSFDYFCFLAGGMAEFMGYFGFVTVPLLMATVATILWASGRDGVKFKRVLTGCIVPAVIPILLLTEGVAFVRPEATAWREGVHPPVPWLIGVPTEKLLTSLTVLSWLELPIATILAWWSRRAWPAVVASSVWWAWVSAFAGAMAEMSVTGKWI
jgi:hypothetical protein